MLSPAEKLAKATKKVPPKRMGKLICTIRARRNQLGLRLTQVSKATGLAQSSLSDIERGAELTMSTARMLTEFYNATIDELWPPLRGREKRAIDAVNAFTRTKLRKEKRHAKST